MPRNQNQSPKKQRPSPTAKATSTSPTPEWLSTTPNTEYSLMADTAESGTVQCIDLTIEEYEALKRHLAKMRGLTVSKPRKHAA